jgi:hypothetical protein
MVNLKTEEIAMHFIPPPKGSAIFWPVGFKDLMKSEFTAPISAQDLVKELRTNNSAWTKNAISRVYKGILNKRAEPLTYEAVEELSEGYAKTVIKKYSDLHDKKEDLKSLASSCFFPARYRLSLEVIPRADFSDYKQLGAEIERLLNEKTKEIYKDHLISLWTGWPNSTARHAQVQKKADTRVNDLCKRFLPFNNETVSRLIHPNCLDYVMEDYVRIAARVIYARIHSSTANPILAERIESEDDLIHSRHDDKQCHEQNFVVRALNVSITKHLSFPT